jgi:hypothetical protein
MISTTLDLRSSNVTVMTAPTLLDLRAAAEVAEVQYRTMRNYHQTAERHRRLAEEARKRGEKNPERFVRPGDLPPPDEVYGRSPVWKLSTINRWLRERPGRGVGGGRPVGWSPNHKEEDE